MAIVLQKPQIAGIKGSTIQVVHPDISDYTKTSLRAPTSVGDTAITVADNMNFANGDLLLFGEAGVDRSEVAAISGAVTRGPALTIAATTKFGHEIDSPVRRVYEKQVRIYGSASSSGTSPTLIATVDIAWSKPWATEYTVVGTTYAYYYATFYDGTTESPISDVIPATGMTGEYIMPIIQQALDGTGAKIGNPSEKINVQFLCRGIELAHNEISQYVDSQTGVAKKWGHEVVLDETLQVATMENTYLLSGLGVTPKHTDVQDSIVSVSIGEHKALEFAPITDFEMRMAGKKRSQLNGAVSAGATSLVVDNSAIFAASGTVIIGGDTITYTANNTTTNTLSGIPASGTGSVTTTQADNKSVWQGTGGSFPTFYTIFDGSIIFNQPFASQWDRYPIRIRLSKKLSPISRVSQTTEIPFYNVLHLYEMYWIEMRRGNDQKAAAYLALFRDAVAKNAFANKSHTLKSRKYYYAKDGDVRRRVIDRYPNSTAGLSQQPTP